MHTEYHFYDYLTGREFLQFIGEIKGMKNLLIEERIKTYSEYFELEDLLDSIIINYSHGTKQKLSFISQIINNPDILILDEPLNGLDPIMIKKMRELVQEILQLSERENVNFKYKFTKVNISNLIKMNNLLIKSL